jgi:hypothetical protein
MIIRYCFENNGCDVRRRVVRDRNNKYTEIKSNQQIMLPYGKGIDFTHQSKTDITLVIYKFIEFNKKFISTIQFQHSLLYQK